MRLLVLLLAVLGSFAGTLPSLPGGAHSCACEENETACCATTAAPSCCDEGTEPASAVLTDERDAGAAPPPTRARVSRGCACGHQDEGFQAAGVSLHLRGPEGVATPEPRCSVRSGPDARRAGRVPAPEGPPPRA